MNSLNIMHEHHITKHTMQFLYENLIFLEGMKRINRLVHLDCVTIFVVGVVLVLCAFIIIQIYLLVLWDMNKW